MAIDAEFDSLSGTLTATYNTSKRSMSELFDPVCKCGHPYSDHGRIAKVLARHINPKEPGKPHWKKLTTNTNGTVTWESENGDRGACRIMWIEICDKEGNYLGLRTPSGMRCKCAAFERKDS